MKEMNCDKVLMAVMAEADDEIFEGDGEEVRLHVERCDTCRQAIEQMRQVDDLLMMAARREHDADLWPAVERRISRSRIGLTPFAVVAALLVGSKLIELLSEHDPGIAFKLVPLAIVAILFAIIRENPFRINSELNSGGII